MQWSDLVANQLHDLKNQLGVLMQQIDSTQAEDRIPLQKSSRLIHDDLNSLLILFRMDENKFKLDRMDLPLCDVPEEAAARHEPLLRSSDIDLQLECDPDAYGFYDRPLLVSVLAHGVLNAINAQAKTIHLQAKLEGQGCCFSVDDDGVGLNAPIEQSERIPGAGVGILLGKEVAAAHKRGEQQGELTLQPSEALGGTQLRLWIPQ
mgnify:CR=1 FL=1